MKPNETNSFYAIGPAIVEFANAKDHKKHIVSYNHFSVRKSRLPFSYNSTGEEITRLNKHTILLTYQADNHVYDDTNADGSKPDFGAGTPDEPFFFKDVNFDNKKELVFAWPLSGQRWRTTYKVFDLKTGEHPFPYDIYHQEPLSSLDSGAIFDKNNKTVTTNLSGGACDSEYRTYKFTHSKGFVLEAGQVSPQRKKDEQEIFCAENIDF